MIVIDGHKSDLAITSFSNLEEVFNTVLENGYLDNKVVTDVYVNKEPFSEIYPHQSEDIETGDIESVEITTMAADEMALNITEELDKVVTIMHQGATRVAELFRQADDAEALEMYQDLLDVNRDFLNMVGTLRDEFALKENDVFREAVEEMTELFTEMTDVLENEDWILLADLLEYEFVPAAEKWKMVIETLRSDIGARQ